MNIIDFKFTLNALGLKYFHYENFEGNPRKYKNYINVYYTRKRVSFSQDGVYLRTETLSSVQLISQ